MGSAACVPLENTVPGKGFNEVLPRSVLGTEKSQELRNCELVVLNASEWPEKSCPCHCRTHSSSLLASGFLTNMVTASFFSSLVPACMVSLISVQKDLVLPCYSNLCVLRSVAVWNSVKALGSILSFFSTEPGQCRAEGSLKAH